MRDDEMTLSALLEQDREMVMAQLLQDRSQEQALKVLEKEADRLTYAAAAAGQGQQKGEPSGKDPNSAAPVMLQVLKNTLPLVTSVTEAEVWEKENGREERGRRVGLPALLSMIAGAVCVIAGVIAPSGIGMLPVPGAVLLAVLGCVLLMAGGFLAGRGREAGKDKGRRNRQMQQTFLVDADRIWHILQGALLGIDHSLAGMREDAGDSKMDTGGETGAGMQKAELQFFADLLENAYARRRRFPSDDALSEQVETIRYYLHTKGIETEEYSAQNAAWFETLPGDYEAVTIRPAMLWNGTLLMKGISSGR